MIRRRLCILLLALSAAAFATGCPTEFVEDAARSSLSSFMTEVFATAVDGTIGP